MRRLMLLVAVVVVVASAIVAMSGSGAGNARPSGTIAFTAKGRIYVIRPDGTHKRLLIDSRCLGASMVAGWTSDRLHRRTRTRRRSARQTGRSDGNCRSGQPSATSQRGLQAGVRSPAPRAGSRRRERVASGVPPSTSGMFAAAAAGSLPREGRHRRGHPTARRSPLTALQCSTSQRAGSERLGSGSTPDWSPDGTKIAYSTDRTIAVMNADGSDRRTIVRSQKLVSDPSWAPDGSRIVYTSAASGGRFTLFIVGADGSGAPRTHYVTAADGDWGPR